MRVLTGRACGATEVVPFPVVVLPNPKTSTGAEARLFLGAVRGAEAPLFHVTARVCGGRPTAGLKSCPSRSWRCQIPGGMGAGEFLR